MHLATIQWLPFALAYLHSYFETNRPRDLRVFAAFATLQALTSGHGIVFLAVASLVVVLSRVACGEPVALGRRARDLGLPGFLLLLPAALMMVPYRQVQTAEGLRRSLENWTVTPESFLASPTHVHEWILGVFHAQRVNEVASAYLFPGFLVLILALAGLAFSVRPAARHSVVTYALVALVSVLLMLPRPLGLWPLVYWLPVFNFIRVPSRFVMLALLGLAVLAGFGVDRLIAFLQSPRRRLVLATSIGALLVAEFAAMPFELTPLRVEIPSVDAWLAGRPEVRAIAELPVASPANLSRAERWHTIYMLHSTAHWKSTVEGYSGIRPPLHQMVYGELAAFPETEAGFRALADLGVTHLVVHLDMYDKGDRERVEKALDHSEWLRVVHTERDGRVYALGRSGA
jgi:hypothetical protein